jgi:hypothetical protein
MSREEAAAVLSSGRPDNQHKVYLLRTQVAELREIANKITTDNTRGLTTNESDSYNKLVECYDETVGDPGQTDAEKLSNAADFANWRGDKLQGKAEKMIADNCSNTPLSSSDEEGSDDSGFNG